MGRQQEYYPKRKKKGFGYVIKCIVRWLIVLIFAAVCFGLAAAGGVYFGFRNSVPEITLKDTEPADYPTVILDAEGNQIAELADFGRRESMTVDELTDTLKWAFVDIEDERFYEHNGIDVKGILRAVYNRFAKHRREGASTITQQLLKNNVFENGGMERSFGSVIRRKVQEWTLAVMLEEKMSKDEILVDYLNTVNMGKGNYGVKTAAIYYFGKDISELTVAETAVLAAIPKSPGIYNPVSSQESNDARKGLVLDKMYENGHLSEAEYKEALAEDVYAGLTGYIPARETTVYSYFVESLIDNVMADLQEKMGCTYDEAFDLLYSGGLTIYSTQNPKAQKIVDEEINNAENYSWDTTWSINWKATVTHSDGTKDTYNEYDLLKYFRAALSPDCVLDFATKEDADSAIQIFKDANFKKGDTVEETVYYTLQPQASFTLMDYTTGEVLAICGGRGTKEVSRSLNRASGTVRQPGSTFKILASFAPALDSGGYTLATLVEDAAYTTDDGKKIRNWWGESYRGWCSVRTAIRDSMNIIAVKVLEDIGINKCLDYLDRFGFTTIDKKEDATLVTAIGGITNGVTNLELCAAYSAIANGGTRMEPFFYSRIIDKDGNVLLERETVQEQTTVLEQETATLLTSAMQDVVSEKGTGKEAAIEGTPVAGKTGTTTDSKDYWFAGYIPNGLAGTVWIGHDWSVAMPENQHSHSVLFSKIMGRVAKELGKEGGEFEIKGHVVEQWTCVRTGQLAVTGRCQYDRGAYLELFSMDVLPGRCSYHSGW